MICYPICYQLISWVGMAVNGQKGTAHFQKFQVSAIFPDRAGCGWTKIIILLGEPFFREGVAFGTFYMRYTNLRCG
jgi:hypothetical protein